MLLSYTSCQQISGQTIEQRSIKKWPLNSHNINSISVSSSFIIRYKVWLFTLAEVLITHRCRTPVFPKSQDVLCESGSRGSNEHTRHGTYCLIHHSFHLQDENPDNACKYMDLKSRQCM